jgi:hypothetical protein
MSIRRGTLRTNIPPMSKRSRQEKVLFGWSVDQIKLTFLLSSCLPYANALLRGAAASARFVSALSSLELWLNDINSTLQNHWTNIDRLILGVVLVLGDQYY